MNLTRRQQWMLFAGATAAAAAPLAGKAVSAAWRRATGEEPPDDADHELDWGKVVLWTISSAIVTGLVQVAARRAAAAAWTGVHGEAPPRPKGARRRRRRSPA